MKVKKITETIKKFTDGEITEDEAIEELKKAEPFDFYAAVSHLYLHQGYRLEKGGLPSVSKLFRKVYDDNLNKAVKELEKDHPIRILATDHLRFERLLETLENISEEIKEESKTNRTDEIRTAVDALSLLNVHIEDEERLVFPAWRQSKRWDNMISYLLEDEHKDIVDAYERLRKKSKDAKQNWTKKDWKTISELIDELSGIIHFHTFHEEDIFYPIIVNQLPNAEYDKIKEKMKNR